MRAKPKRKPYIHGWPTSANSWNWWVYVGDGEQKRFDTWREALDYANRRA